jgi:hypothetical protein
VKFEIVFYHPCTGTIANDANAETGRSSSIQRCIRLCQTDGGERGIDNDHLFKSHYIFQGFFAVYKGMAAPIVGVAPIFAIFFGGCSIGRWLQQSHPGQEMT